MKVAFDLAPIEGPYGGGNSFLVNLSKGLLDLGISVHYKLNEKNLDFIFLLDPRWNHPNRSFSSSSVIKYLRRNPETIIIHRINECDERKNTRNVNKKLRKLNYLADSTVFVSSWLKCLNVVDNKKRVSTKYSDAVIINGSDREVFYPGSEMWDGKSKIRIVTHHWSSNAMKGKSTYQELDNLLDSKSYSDFFEFTYIGNAPRDANFKNTKLIPPLSGIELASELKRHHVYLTGSINEPGGNHQNEGGLCGLPIIYIESGSMREYCDGFGIAMNSSVDLAKSLWDIRNRYFELRERMQYFPNSSDRMVAQYVHHFKYLQSIREELYSDRRLFRDPLTLLRLMMPI